jgi:ribonuclease HI
MKYYAVRRGRIPGVYEEWSECEAQVKGFPNALYKSFRTRLEAEFYLLEEEAEKQESPVVPAPPAEEEPEPDSLLPEEKEGPAWPEIYVDGSFRADTGEYSYGMVILEGGEELYFSEKFTDPDMALMRNVAGEIRGAQAAMEYALRQGWHGIYLYHDYAGIAKWCTGEWKATKPGTEAYRDFYRHVRERLDVIFIKVKGHSHDRCNDLADELAKKALGIGEEEEEATTAPSE